MAGLGVFAFLFVPLWSAVTVQAQTACKAAVDDCAAYLEGAAIVNISTGSFTTVTNHRVWANSCNQLVETRNCIGAVAVTNCEDAELAVLRLPFDLMNVFLCDLRTFSLYDEMSECLVDIENQTSSCDSSLGNAGLLCSFRSVNDSTSCYTDPMAKADNCYAEVSVSDAIIDFLVRTTLPDCIPPACRSLTDACLDILEGATFMEFTHLTFTTVTNENAWMDSCNRVFDTVNCFAAAATHCDYDDGDAGRSEELFDIIHTLLCDGHSFDDYQGNSECLRDVLSVDYDKLCSYSYYDCCESSYNFAMATAEMCRGNARNPTFDAIERVIQLVFSDCTLPVWYAMTGQVQTACQSSNVLCARLLDLSPWKYVCFGLRRTQNCIEDLAATYCEDAELAALQLPIDLMNTLLCEEHSFEDHENNYECLVDVENRTSSCDSSLGNAGLSCRSAHDFESCYNDAMTHAHNCSDNARNATLDAIKGLVQAVLPACGLSGGPAVGPSWHLVAMVAVASTALLAI